ncbi:hypothetical protein Pan97_21680 [Bremerella volcania]|uniref:Uncharacterized protein n=1 Tax=Bremerella volcania TaxID=2527984 RepID=A0A518C7E0_9BACT|nr:hypothetical protein [Bremerella volcania]QDU75145.1 hypothetical protein Pan97_21680 [Bremerella volcania]
MSKNIHNPFQSPTEASQLKLPRERSQKIVWRARLGWIFPLLAFAMIGFTWTLYVVWGRQMDLVFIFSIPACLLVGIAYSSYAVFMSTKVQGVQPQAILGVIANTLLVMSIGIVLLS